MPVNSNKTISFDLGKPYHPGNKNYELSEKLNTAYTKFIMQILLNVCQKYLKK